MKKCNKYKFLVIGKKFIFSVLTVGFIILFIVSILNIIIWYVNNKENQEIQEQLSSVVEVEHVSVENNEQIRQEEQVKYKIDFNTLKKINSDTVAWIKVNGTNIEHTVVKTVDNSYYLNHNFEKKYNKAGWIFADYKNKLDGTDKNIIVYGHNMKDDSMFGTLENILKQTWYDNYENYVIDFITEKEELKYQVFSVYEIENEDYYIKTNFENGEFDKFLQTLKNRSAKDFGVDISSQDSILTLSTCADNDNYRIVLHAKKFVQ